MNENVSIIQITKSSGVPPAAAQPGLTTVGRSGSLAVRGRNGVSWVRRAAREVTQTPGGVLLPGSVRRGIPWLLGGSVAWEFGRQLWEGLQGGKLMGEDGNLIGTLADGCLSLSDLVTDHSQLKKLVSDLNALKTVRSEAGMEASEFFKQIKNPGAYSLTEEGLVCVTEYVSWRFMQQADFLFDTATLRAIYFSAVYVSCFNKDTGKITPPADTSWEGLDETLGEITASVIDDTRVFDGYRQLVELDAWVKLSELLDRLRHQGRPVRTGDDFSGPGYTSVEYESPSADPWAGEENFSIM